jgi:hypothetical protein
LSYGDLTKHGRKVIKYIDYSVKRVLELPRCRANGVAKTARRYSIEEKYCGWQEIMLTTFKTLLDSVMNGNNV